MHHAQCNQIRPATCTICLVMPPQSMISEHTCCYVVNVSVHESCSLLPQSTYVDTRRLPLYTKEARAKASCVLSYNSECDDACCLHTLLRPPSKHTFGQTVPVIQSCQVSPSSRDSFNGARVQESCFLMPMSDCDDARCLNDYQQSLCSARGIMFYDYQQSL